MELIILLPTLTILTCNKLGATRSYTMLFQPIILLPVFIAAFYAKYWSFYGDLFVLHS